MSELSVATEGALAPDFTLPDLDGHAVTLSSFKGKVVLLDVWATWCPPCRAMIPHERRQRGTVGGSVGFAPLHQIIVEVEGRITLHCCASTVSHIYVIRT